MKKFIRILPLALAITLALSSCDVTADNGSKDDTKSTIEIADRLQSNQPTPKDINYSLERYNLIRRTYWVNGQREKANALVCEIEKPLGYIVLFTGSGSVVGRFVVDGKVTRGFYAAMYELGTQKTPRLRLISDAVESNISTIREIQGQYLSAIADANRAEAMVDENEDISDDEDV